MISPKQKVMWAVGGLAVFAATYSLARGHGAAAAPGTSSGQDAPFGGDLSLAVPGTDPTLSPQAGSDGVYKLSNGFWDNGNTPGPTGATGSITNIPGVLSGATLSPATASAVQRALARYDPNQQRLSLPANTRASVGSALSQYSPGGGGLSAAISRANAGDTGGGSGGRGGV